MATRGKQVLELVTALCIENHTVVVASHDPEIIRLAILNRVHVPDGRSRPMIEARLVNCVS